MITTAKRVGTLTLVLLLSLAITAQAQQPDLSGAAKLSGADLLPQTTGIYLEITSPDKLIQLVREHPIRKQLESLDQYKQAMNGRQLRQARDMIAIIENRSGLKFWPAIEKITGGGVFVAVDTATEGFVFMVKAKDQATLEKTRDTLFTLGRDDASNKGKPDPFQPIETYRGIPIYKGDGKGGYAFAGPWLIVANNGDLGKSILDKTIDGAKNTLSASKEFQAAKEKACGTSHAPTGWAYLRLDEIRKRGIARDVFEKQAENPVAELLVGAIQNTLQNANYLVGAINVDQTSASISFAAPHDQATVPKQRAYTFAPNGGGAPKALKPKDTLLSLTTYRDISGMWLAADELFDENTAAGMAQADSNLSQFFQGQSFSSEILKEIKPQIQLVFARQDFKNSGEPVPNAKFPAGALVFQVKDPAQMKTRMQVAYQMAVGIGNFTNMQQGRPPMLQKNYEHGKGTIMSASYMEKTPPKKDDGSPQGASGGEDYKQKSVKGAMYYNFSPAIGMVGEYLILSSTKQLAEQLIDAAAKHDPEATAKANTHLELDAAVGSKILADNLKQLIAQNMLRRGHNMEEAATEVELFMELLSMFKGAHINLNNDDKTMRLELGVSLTPQKSASK